MSPRPLDVVLPRLERTSVAGEQHETDEERRWIEGMMAGGVGSSDRRDALASCRAAGLLSEAGMPATDRDVGEIFAVIVARMVLAEQVEAGALVESLKPDGTYEYCANAEDDDGDGDAE